ncbi:MAG TPA: ATP-binding protein [Planctomycetaceae bacterium]|nr:ATP-binding protein [Planctomycetaceae bacterium]
MEALTELAERTRSDGKVNCTFRCPEPVSLPNGQNAAHIYLIAREAVHNSLKHAQARNVDIDLAKMDGGLVLTVKDDGVGMAVPPKEHAGLGLRIMRGRAAIIGAKLTIEQCRPSGTLVTCAWQGAGNVQEEEQQTGPDPDC